jgi:hypothetical protein
MAGCMLAAAPLCLSPDSLGVLNENESDRR